MRALAISASLVLALLAGSPAQALPGAEAPVRLKDLVRIESARPNPLAGYGLVVGLAGTGDSSRSRATAQSVANALSRMGLNVDPAQLNSRNAAVVMVTASLPPFANIGDTLDANVSSLGDARSLAGGTLLMTALMGPNDKTYALVQGPITVGGYRYDAFGNLVQKNHPTVGIVAGGATVERDTLTRLLDESGSLGLVLKAPDFTTARRIAEALAGEFGSSDIRTVGPDRVVLHLNDVERTDLVGVMQRMEALSVVPDVPATVVVNERTGTIVSGGDVRLEAASIVHGELRISIETDYLVSQPSLVARTGSGVGTAIVPDTTISAKEAGSKSLSVPAGTTVADFAVALNKLDAPPRDVISIFQALHRAGALHADVIVQ